MAVLAFQLFILFAAVKYGELSVRDNSNIRDVVGENELIDSNQTMATIISQGTADFQHHVDQMINNQTDCTERYHTEYDNSGRFKTSSQPYHRSLREIQWKINMFWATVAVISILWVFILIGLTAIVYVRIVYMHHSISQIFCPKD
ncbi:hypothetical protein ACH3XW_18605 [Acanthocheilonema viteae]